MLIHPLDATSDVLTEKGCFYDDQKNWFMSFVRFCISFFAYLLGVFFMFSQFFSFVVYFNDFMSIHAEVRSRKFNKKIN